MNIKELLKNGAHVKGCMLSELYTPNLSRLFHTLGMEFLLLDCEHGYFDMTQAANLIAVADGYGLPVIVRVGQHSQYSVPKFLDMGARGILHPNVVDAAQARELVAMCLYAPEGDRGISTFRAHTGYQNGDIPEVMRRANAHNVVIAQIESMLTSQQIDAIVSVDGLDGVLIGPNDLSQSVGAFGEYGHPDLLRVVNDVAASARRHDKWSGVITANEKLLRHCAACGMQFFSVGSELSMLASGAQNTLQKIENILQDEAPAGK